ncbi:hypothetical protein CYMTET_30395 [Cymbomonas tetramitiformis]|uniref:Glycosyl transferase 64 domain-containing protein n=1 Tax=Cymbomonas tetramitiformis TaxID=36881 RepID=A0AAE0KU87_9CHLO|nr:hypothetical protein CYMTET_30395 [Cymbomonas tetramitiformis]
MGASGGMTRRRPSALRLSTWQWAIIGMILVTVLMKLPTSSTPRLSHSSKVPVIPVDGAETKVSTNPWTHSSSSTEAHRKRSTNRLKWQCANGRSASAPPPHKTTSPGPLCLMQSDSECNRQHISASFELQKSASSCVDAGTRANPCVRVVTLILMTGGRTSMDVISQLVDHYSTMPIMKEVLLVWNDVDTEPPWWLTQETASDAPTQNVVRVLKMERNTLLNRYGQYEQISTEAVFVTDDDLVICAQVPHSPLPLCSPFSLR